MKKVSIVIPAYNSGQRVETLLKKLKQLQIRNFEKEIIVVDDASTNDTSTRLKKVKGIILIRHKTNTGKGGAIKTGLQKAKGDIILMQDDDLEYDPEDIPKL